MAVAANQIRQVAEEAIGVIERQHWLDGLATRLQKAVAAAFGAGGAPGRRVRDLLHGTWLGHPLHPVLTDIPLGAWTAALVLDAMAPGRKGVEQAADAAIAVGLAGATGAAVTGLTDWHHTADADRRLGLAHGLLNTGATALYVAALAFRRSGAREAGRVLAGAGFLVAMGAAYIGGSLVYKKRIGVDHADRPETTEEFTAVLPEAELQEERPARVTARGVPIVLVRRAGRVYALGERCAHLGGPLAEGALEGDALRCPWHGSLFALEDGRVLEGPSTYSQPCFETRVRAGQVEVRARG